VPLFADEADVYATIGAMFEALVADPQLGPKLGALNTVLYVRFTTPDAHIVLDATQAHPTVALGTVPGSYGTRLSMTADVGHRFWLGRLNVAAALARGQVRSDGNMAKLMRLLPVMKPAFALYADLLRTRGRQDLLEGA